MYFSVWMIHMYMLEGEYLGDNREQELISLCLMVCPTSLSPSIESALMIAKYALSARRRKIKHHKNWLLLSVIALALVFARTFLSSQKYYSFIWLVTLIENSLPTPMPVKITIFLDVPPGGTRALRSDERKRLLQMLRHIRSRHGPVTVEKRKQHFGLKENVLSSWVPQSAKEYAVFILHVHHENASFATSYHGRVTVQ
ncbi:hypothetical protein M9435_002974 [Picochlorum sp. BPE23]|nr:hypothetical protein M9435_002974 [Picochlorum sp. BPE23]